MSKTDTEQFNDIQKRMERSGMDFSAVTLRDMFTQVGLNPDLVEKAIKDYQRYRYAETSYLSILTGDQIRELGAEALANRMIKMRMGIDIVEEILIGYLRYINYKNDIVEAYQESKDWNKVITTVVYSDIKESDEAFIDYVEETYQTKIKDAKHLQKLTGITEDTLEGLEEVLLNSRYTKYFRALDISLQKGAKYKDLLQIKPQDFGLPKIWSGCLGSDQYSTILWALSFEFLINEPASLMMLPDLRSIAYEVEAPYSVLMDCYNLTNKGKKYGD